MQHLLQLRLLAPLQVLPLIFALAMIPNPMILYRQLSVLSLQ
jgi:hypothetical protein